MRPLGHLIDRTRLARPVLYESGVLRAVLSASGAGTTRVDSLTSDALLGCLSVVRSISVLRKKRKHGPIGFYIRSADHRFL